MPVAISPKQLLPTSDLKQLLVKYWQVLLYLDLEQLPLPISDLKHLLVKHWQVLLYPDLKQLPLPISDLKQLLIKHWQVLLYLDLEQLPLPISDLKQLLIKHAQVLLYLDLKQFLLSISILKQPLLNPGLKQYPGPTQMPELQLLRTTGATMQSVQITTLVAMKNSHPHAGEEQDSFLLKITLFCTWFRTPLQLPIRC